MSESPILLLVEDECLIALILEEELGAAGYGVVVAEDGGRAIEKLRADAPRFRAVITDIRLGAGPDGWTVGHTAREISATMPIVYISGDNAVNWAANGVSESVMLPKPFAPAQLVTAVSALIGRTERDLARPSP